MKTGILHSVCLLVVMLASSRGMAGSITPADYLAFTHESSYGVDLPYRLFVPSDYTADGPAYPIVTYLHGAGGAGTDNFGQFSNSNIWGATVWAEPDKQAEFPAFVLVPQSEDNSYGWGQMGLPETPYLSAYFELLDDLELQYNIDLSREYITGQSMGGYGTWAALSQQPDRFAAAVPLAADGDSTYASLIADIPQWVFHGELDTAVPFEGAAAVVAAMELAGGEPLWTLYSDLGHLIGERVYSEAELLPWLYSYELALPGLAGGQLPLPPEDIGSWIEGDSQGQAVALPGSLWLLLLPFGLLYRRGSLPG